MVDGGVEQALLAALNAERAEIDSDWMSLETDDVHGIFSELESPDELFELETLTQYLHRDTLVAGAHKIDATAFCKHLDKVLSAEGVGLGGSESVDVSTPNVPESSQADIYQDSKCALKRMVCYQLRMADIGAQSECVLTRGNVVAAAVGTASGAQADVGEAEDEVLWAMSELVGTLKRDKQQAGFHSKDSRLVRTALVWWGDDRPQLGALNVPTQNLQDPPSTFTAQALARFERPAPVPRDDSALVRSRRGAAAGSGRFEVDALVDCQHQSTDHVHEDGQWFPAKITVVNTDGTYGVLYLDGSDESEARVPARRVRPGRVNLAELDLFSGVGTDGSASDHCNTEWSLSSPVEVPAKHILYSCNLWEMCENNRGRGEEHRFWLVKQDDNAKARDRVATHAARLAADDAPTL